MRPGRLRADAGRMRPRRSALIPVLTVLLALAGCATTTPEQVGVRLSDLPGVVSVQAGSDGDDDLPFGQSDVYVIVEMASDATADQVATVLDVDPDVVVGIEVRMAGPKSATLATGGDPEDGDRLAGDLVAAYGDADVRSYSRGWRYVSIQLATENFRLGTVVVRSRSIPWS